MSDNPFIEPEDGERTVIRPTPGGRRAAPADAPVGLAEAPPRSAAASPAASDGVETVAMGVSPLVAAAAPLLQLMVRLRNTINQPDPGDLRERADHRGLAD
jgi:type VI secretion system protein ImpK